MLRKVYPAIRNFGLGQPERRKFRYTHGLHGFHRASDLFFLQPLEGLLRASYFAKHASALYALTHTSIAQSADIDEWQIFLIFQDILRRLS